MKIAIEAQRIFRRNKHGMDFVVLEVLRQLQHVDTDNEYHVFVSPGEDRCLVSSSNMFVHEIGGMGGYPAWEQWFLPRAVQALKPDLLHCTSNTAPLMCDVPLVLTLHDVIFLEKQQQKNSSLYQQLGRIYRRWVVPVILPKCRRIITVSNYECRRIGEFLGLPTSQLTYIHNGYGSHFTPVADWKPIASQYIDADSYFMFLGNTDPKKNTSLTLLAYARYLEQSTVKQPLLLADLEEPYLMSQLREQNIEWIRPYLHRSGYVVNSHLPALYSGATAFLYTSLRESFGIPILEAMACATPVVASCTSAIPEVAGEGAILIDPTDVEAIAVQLLRLENDALYRGQAVAYGLARVKHFSWRKTAVETLNVYRQVAGV